MDQLGPIEVTYSQLADMIEDHLQSERAAYEPVSPLHSLEAQHAQHMEAAAMTRAIGYVFGTRYTARYMVAFKFVHELPLNAVCGQAAIDLMKLMRRVPDDNAE